MVLWAVVMFGLFGLSLDFGFGGLMLGMVLGWIAGTWLRIVVREEIARRIAEVSFDIAQAAPPAEPARPAPEPAAAAEIELERRPAPEPEPAFATQAPEPPLLGGEVSLPQREAYQRAAYHDIEPTPAERLFAAAKGWLLGGNTILRVGLVILFVGLVFLARLVAGSFSLEARLATIAAAGAGLLGFGFSRRTTKPEYSLHLQGAGVAVMYLTVFASGRIYEVMPSGAAFAFMVVIAVLGAVLAVMQDSLVMALAAFLGGYAVPVLLGGDAKTPLPLFTYFTVLNLAVLGIAWKKSWRPLNLLGFFATFGMATLWGVTSYTADHYMVSQVFLALSVAIFLAMAVLYAHNTPGPLGNMADSTLLFGPAIAGFGLQVGLTRPWEYGSSFSALAFGASYLGVTAFTMRKRREEMRLLNESMLAIGVGFVTLAIPLALDAKWTASAWALEGAGAFWVGARQARWMPRAFGLLLQLIAGAIVLTTLEENVSAVPLANSGFIGAMLIAAPVLFTAWWMRTHLPHSGSTLARGYAPVEAALAKPWFLSGFGFVMLGIILEAWRALPAATSEAWPEPVLAPHAQIFAVLLGILAAMGISDWFGRRHDWKVASVPGRFGVVLLAISFLHSVLERRYVLYLPDLAVWAVAIAGHLLLLRRQDAGSDPEGDAVGSAIHAGGVWLLTAMISNALWLGIDRADLWQTSWAGVVFLVACLGMLMALTRWAGRAAPLDDAAALGWPLARHHRAYWWGAAIPLVLLTWGGALLTALVAQGVTDPLPYVPILNPVDLSVALALVALALWRRVVAGAASQPPGSAPVTEAPAAVFGAFLAFAAANSIWLRTAHHFLGVAWTPDAMGSSPEVQTGLAILWTLMAMALMLFAQRRAMRAPWLVGAGLLALVVAKLLLVDMSNAQSWARIVTFVGVGGLMLVIGYFVPLPPRQGGQQAEGEE